MDLLMRHNSFDKYLQDSEAIDQKNPKIQFAAQFLMDKMMRELEEYPGNALPDPEMQLARTTYEYVRDRISHSWDIQNALITWKASAVLENKPSIAAEFSITEEKLAFPVHPGLQETDIPIIFACPDRTVLLTLQKYENLPELMENLPQKLFGDE